MSKILIVEDDPLMMRMYQKAFGFEGYEVMVARDGVEGLELIRAEKPTIVLLDVMMPRMNGMEVLEKVKADPETKSIPVIMLTNLAGGRDAEDAIMKGTVKYIVKSEHDPQETVAMVKEILAGYSRDEVPTV